MDKELFKKLIEALSTINNTDVDFAKMISEQLEKESNISITENGAKGYATTKHPLLDLTYMISSLRDIDTNKESMNKASALFMKALEENSTEAIRWLFYLRDPRGGIGERALFKFLLPIAGDYIRFDEETCDLIKTFGRYDDLIEISMLGDELGYEWTSVVYKYYLSHLIAQMIGKEDVDLLAKWLPSVQTKKPEHKKFLKNMLKTTGLFDEKNYRKALSYLRKQINLVERNMSSKEWKGIEYDKVPSRAALLYKEAFSRNDPIRYSQYVKNLSSGKTKINASVTFPYEIVNQYRKSFEQGITNPVLEKAWESLPNYSTGDQNILVVRDGSGSMETFIGNTHIEAADIADSLSIYFAQKNSGVFHNKFITFSTNPKMVDITGIQKLSDILEYLNAFDDWNTTNIYAVFQIILSTAIKNHIVQEDLPSTVLIISDMEFDCANCTDKLFDKIKTDFSSFGYKLPKIAFWNVNSRSCTIPAIDNDNGIILLSGFSPTIIKMVLSGKTDPYEALQYAIGDKKYDVVEKIIK